MFISRKSERKGKKEKGKRKGKGKGKEKEEEEEEEKGWNLKRLKKVVEHTCLYIKRE